MNGDYSDQYQMLLYHTLSTFAERYMKKSAIPIISFRRGPRSDSYHIPVRLTPDDCITLIGMMLHYISYDQILRIYNDVASSFPRLRELIPFPRPEFYPGLIMIGDLAIDTRAHEVFMDGKPIELTPTEYKLLCFLASNPRQVFTCKQLLEQVWGYPLGYGADDLVRMHIFNLRGKLEKDPSEPEHIINKRKRGSTGYRYDP